MILVEGMHSLPPQPNPPPMATVVNGSDEAFSAVVDRDLLWPVTAMVK